MTQSKNTEQGSSAVRQLTVAELTLVAGGMKWDHNYVNKDVIDARGGSVTFMGLTMTLDVHGKLSSIS